MKRKTMELEALSEAASSMYGEQKLWLDLESGNMFRISPDAGARNEFYTPEDLKDLQRTHELIELPGRREFREKAVMEDYASQLADDKQGAILQTRLSGRNPYRSFRQTLNEFGLYEDYEDFKKEQDADLMADWLDERGIAWRHALRLDDLASAHSVRFLKEEDIRRILKLARSNPQFYKAEPPLPSAASIREDMSKLPAGLDRGRKYYLGYFEGDHLIAVLDLLLDYPQENCAWIGFFMVDQEHSGKGLGSRLIQQLLDTLAALPLQEVRLGVAQFNAQGLAFWKKNGFEPAGSDVRGHVLMSLKLEAPAEEETEEDVHVWSF